MVFFHKHLDWFLDRILACFSIQFLDDFLFPFLFPFFFLFSFPFFFFPFFPFFLFSFSFSPVQRRVHTFSHRFLEGWNFPFSRLSGELLYVGQAKTLCRNDPDPVEAQGLCPQSFIYPTPSPFPQPHPHSCSFLPAPSCSALLSSISIWSAACRYAACCCCVNHGAPIRNSGFSWAFILYDSGHS